MKVTTTTSATTDAPSALEVASRYRFKCTFSGTISDAMKRRGWTQTNNNDFSIYWCDMRQVNEAMNNLLLSDKQRVGHFRNCQEISRKNLLVKNLKKLRSRLDKAFGKEVAAEMDFMPDTFILPIEHRQFVAEFRASPNTLWIIKPAAGAQGRGIFIFRNLKDYSEWRQNFVSQIDQNIDAVTLANQEKDSKQDIYVIQKYISNPYLIGGRKFDIRFYVLVTSFTPLTAWTYREGFARFSAGQFSLDALQDVYIHLTNVAIQKTSQDYNPKKGSKWSLQSLREYLTARHGNQKVQKLFNKIDTIVIRTLQSGQNEVYHDKHCFEIYGFDVIIDGDLVPWLLELNASPAFTPSNEEDYVLKTGLIDDTVTVLDLENRLTGLEKRIGGYDLIVREDVPIYANPSECLGEGHRINSFLGCKNDRIPQLRTVYRTSHFLKKTNKILHEDDNFKLVDLKCHEERQYKLPAPEDT